MRTIRDLICPQAVSASLHLAVHEMGEIKGLDDDTLDTIKDCRMLYGQTDDWAPIDFYHNLLSVIPGEILCRPAKCSRNNVEIIWLHFDFATF